MTLTLEMQILEFMHEKGIIRRRDVYEGILGAKNPGITGRHLNSLITAGFVEQFEEFVCPYCRMPIEGMVAKATDKSIKLTESGEMMAKTVIQMGEKE